MHIDTPVHVYTVFLDRGYASPEVRQKLEPCAPLAQCHVKSTNRSLAAYSAWEKHGSKWLKLVDPSRPFKISLHVGRKGSTTEAASRLSPVKVHDPFKPL